MTEACWRVIIKFTEKKKKDDYMERIQDVKILIVDDNEELLEMLEKILKKE